MKGKILPKEEFHEILEALVGKVKNGSSPEGTISWTNLGPDEYEVIVFAKIVDTFNRNDAVIIGDLEV